MCHWQASWEANGGVKKANELALSTTLSGIGKTVTRTSRGRYARMLQRRSDGATIAHAGRSQGAPSAATARFAAAAPGNLPLDGSWRSSETPLRPRAKHPELPRAERLTRLRLERCSPGTQDGCCSARSCPVLSVPDDHSEGLCFSESSQLSSVSPWRPVAHYHPRCLRTRNLALPHQLFQIVIDHERERET